MLAPAIPEWICGLGRVGGRRVFGGGDSRAVWVGEVRLCLPRLSPSGFAGWGGLGGGGFSAEGMGYWRRCVFNLLEVSEQLLYARMNNVEQSLLTP